MAVTFSRPDPSRPDAVADATFSTARRGYQPDEVRTVLRDVAAELRRLQARVAELETELDHAQRAAAETPTELDEDTATRLLGEETVRVLRTARESAAQIRARAEENASRIVRDATEESSRVRSDAEVEAARVREDAAKQAESEVSLAKQQGREMVNEARAYRERVLEELTKRREAARQQIDQLVHGRDRLLQVFERARLVAVDVVAELEPLVEPDEYVNLSPTTGPIPMTVPSAALPRRDERPVRDQADDTGEETSGGAVGADDDTDDDTSGDADVLHDAAPADATVADEAAADDTTTSGADPERAIGSSSDESSVSSDTTTTDDADATVEAVSGPTGAADAVDGVTPTADVPEADGGSAGSNADAPAADDASEDGSAVEAIGVGELDQDRAGAAPSSNVVQLFGGQAGTTDAADESPEAPDAHGQQDATTTATARPDVDGLFARLRAEAVGTGDTDEPSASASPDTSGADASGADASGGDDEDGNGTEETPFERRDAVLVPVIVAAGRKLKRILADEQNDVLGQLRDPRRTGALVDLLADPEAHVSRWFDAIGAEVAEAHRAGVRTVDTSGHVPAPDLDRVRTYVADELVLPLRERLERADADAGDDTEALVRTVRSVYREWKSQHIDAQLDDVLLLAHGDGVLAAATPGTALRWTVDPRHTACPDCEDNALAGAVTAGDEYPTGHRCAPAHAGCRCLLVPTGQ